MYITTGNIPLNNSFRDHLKLQQCKISGVMTCAKVMVIAAPYSCVIKSQVLGSLPALTTGGAQ